MKMSSCRLHLLVSFLVFSTASIAIPSAHAIDLTVLAGLNVHSPSIDPETAGTEISGGAGVGFGALVGTELMPAIGIESGVLFVKRDVNTQVANTDIETTSSSMEIPLLLRFTALPILSVGGGLYYSRNSRSFDREGRVLGVAVDDEVEDADLKRNEFGARLNVRGTTPLAPLFSGVLDVSYNLGLTDIDLDPNSSRKTRELQIMVGLNFGF